MEKQELQKPFFAQFLEGQFSETAANSEYTTSVVKDMDETHKFPSDSDEDWRS